jgi:hypothetical protein
MTYLEIVNKVMRRLREPTVGSVSENSYSRLVGEFVNDAKRVVEDAWAWRGLLDTVPIVTVGGTTFYDFQDVNCTISGAPATENARLYVDPETGEPLIRITTDNQEAAITLVSPSYKFIERQREANDNSTGKPSAVFFQTTSTPTSGRSSIRIRFNPTPDNVYAVSFFVINPQNDLESDSTSLLVPSFPVVQLAYLYSLYERGEEIGESLTLTSEKADKALADAIAFDSSMTSEFIFRPN